jgi:hypothetical protein
MCISKTIAIAIIKAVSPNCDARLSSQMPLAACDLKFVAKAKGENMKIVE